MRPISLQLILSVLFHLGWIPHQWGWPRVYIFLPLPFVKIAKLVLNRSLQSDAVGRVFSLKTGLFYTEISSEAPRFMRTQSLITSCPINPKTEHWLFTKGPKLYGHLILAQNFRHMRLRICERRKLQLILKPKYFKDSKGYLKLQVKINLSVGLWMWGLREEPSKHSWVQRVCFLLKWALCYYMFSWVGADYYLSILEQIPGFIAVVLRRRGW